MIHSVRHFGEYYQMRDMSELLKLSSKLFEENLQKNDIQSIFSAASRKSSFLKKEININDLLKIWKEHRFPTDSKDIVNILKDVGFSSREINKVFKKAGYGSADAPAVSSAMNKISAYIIKHGYTEDILKFLKNNYNGIEETYVADGNIVIEDLRNIFTEIVKEDRPDLSEYIRKEQQQNLGRIKKPS